MLAPKYIEQNIISSVCQFERFKQHRERVQMIASDRANSKKQFHLDRSKLLKIKSSQHISKQSQYNMKQRQLHLENSKILDRIIKIKPSTRQHSASSIRSLNLPKRKKEAMKIVDENQKLMKRLQQTHGTFRNKETMQRDYRKTQELKSRISRSDNKMRICKFASTLSQRKNKFTTDLQQLRVEPLRKTLPKLLQNHLFGFSQ